MTTKADLLKPRTTQIEVDNVLITIRALSASYAMGLRGRDMQGAEIFDVIAVSIIDENGAPMLTAEEVGKIAISTLEQIVKSIFSFNSLGQKAVDEAVEELKKTDGLTSN